MYRVVVIDGQAFTPEQLVARVMGVSATDLMLARRLLVVDPCDPRLATQRCWEHDDCAEHPELGLACGPSTPIVFVRDTGEGLDWQFKGAEAGKGFVDGCEHSGDSIGGDYFGSGDGGPTMNNGDGHGGPANARGCGEGWVGYGNSDGGGRGPNIPGV